MNERAIAQSPDPATAVNLNAYRPDEWPFLLTAAEVSALLRVDTNTVTRWCSDGKLDASKIGREWRISAEAVWPMIPATIRSQWPDGPWRQLDK